MDNWIEYAPAGGWAAFACNDAMTKALHARLPEDDWHYHWQHLNFVKISEVWESRRDASVVVAHFNINQFVDDSLVHLATKGDAAGAIVGSLAVEFGLAPALSLDTEPGAVADDKAP